MKIISYNVNGIRAAMNKNLDNWLDDEQPDIIGFQEIKANIDQINLLAFEERNYHTYWFPAERKGYSGVGFASKIAPEAIVYGMDIDRYDSEGRLIRLDFEDFSLLSVYVPSASNIERLDFKMEFCYEFAEYIATLREQIPNLIIGGDFNICHEAIDIHDPVRLKNVSGFLPMEREWMTNFMEKCGLIDGFRHFHKEPHQYTWWSYRQNSRAKNKGWRLDYHFMTEPMIKSVKKVGILSEAYHSDHAPIVLEL